MNPAPLYGFLTVLEAPEVGYFGGYLVVNERARPVEFHCTAPLLPSRAEEILFGATLKPHIFCDRIGEGLLAKANAKVAIVLVNQPETWPLAGEGSPPVVLVTKHSTPDAAPPSTTQVALDRVDPSLRATVETQLALLERYVPLDEPFGRIAEALNEAGRVAPPSEATRDQAA